MSSRTTTAGPIQRTRGSNNGVTMVSGMNNGRQALSKKAARLARKQGRQQAKAHRRIDVRNHYMRREGVDRARRAVQKLVRKHFGDELPDLIVLEYDYWLLRVMGYDVLLAEFRYPRRGLRNLETMPDPRDSETWLWWRGCSKSEQFDVARGSIVR
jgi:hypothetical protein